YAVMLTCATLLLLHITRFRHRSALHSFPTRRSSDLVRADGDDEQGKTVRIGPFVAVLCVRGGGSTPFGGHELYFRSLAAFGRPLDRKSTRLNSSHVKISYAVFCLKKKTTTVQNNAST